MVDQVVTGFELVKQSQDYYRSSSEVNHHGSFDSLLDLKKDQVFPDNLFENEDVDVALVLGDADVFAINEQKISQTESVRKSLSPVGFTLFATSHMEHIEKEVGFQHSENLTRNTADVEKDRNSILNKDLALKKKYSAKSNNRLPVVDVGHSRKVKSVNLSDKLVRTNHHGSLFEKVKSEYSDSRVQLARSTNGFNVYMRLGNPEATESLSILQKIFKFFGSKCGQIHSLIINGKKRF